MSHVIVNLFLEVLVLNIVFAFGTNQHLICKTVEDVFTDGSIPSHTRTTPRVLHGPPGKRGHPGVKGESGIPGLKGERGLPGIVDRQLVENVVEEKLREANAELLGRIEILERFVTKMNSTIAASASICEGGFKYRSKCYFTIMHDNRDVTHQQGRDLCIAKGGGAVTILNREHVDLVVSHVRSQTASQRQILIGMSYNPSTSTLSWSNGDNVPADVAASMRWWSGYPSGSSSYDTIELVVNSGRFGIFNVPPSYISHGVVCEK